jgi:branched-chain amino acid aminotransferase
MVGDDRVRHEPPAYPLLDDRFGAGCNEFRNPLRDLDRIPRDLRNSTPSEVDPRLYHHVAIHGTDAYDPRGLETRTLSCRRQVQLVRSHEQPLVRWMRHRRPQLLAVRAEGEYLGVADTENDLIPSLGDGRVGRVDKFLDAVPTVRDAVPPPTGSRDRDEVPPRRADPDGPACGRECAARSQGTAPVAGMNDKRPHDPNNVRGACFPTQSRGGVSGVALRTLVTGGRGGEIDERTGRRRFRVKSDPSKWGVTSLQLQRPEHVFFDRQIRPWEEAVFHVSSEAVVRGLNVFEGLKGYWAESDSFGLRTLRRHYDRMRRSARLLHIPVAFDYDWFEEACFAITRAELRPGKDLYIRATLFVVEGHYGEGTVADLVLTAYQQDKGAPDAIDVGISTWRRAPDVSMPARIKTSANYQIARLARIEGRSRGFEDMILLNQSGRVSEGLAACVLLVRDGRVYTPPAYEGALESITLDIVESLASSLGIDLTRRPIERSELYIADELGLTGTLSEITRVRSIDEAELPEDAPILSALERRYREAVLGIDPHPSVELSIVPSPARTPTTVGGTGARAYSAS